MHVFIGIRAIQLQLKPPAQGQVHPSFTHMPFQSLKVGKNVLFQQTLFAKAFCTTHK